MKKKVLTAAAVAAFLLFHVWLVFLSKHDILALDVGPNSVPSPHITGQTKIGQTYRAPSDGVHRIDILLGTHERINDRDIFFRMWEGVPGGKKAAEVVFNAGAVNNNRYYPVVFRPIAGSAGKSYSFVLSSPLSTPENSLSVWMNSKDVYSRGTALINGLPVKGDLTFRVYARRSVASEITRLLMKTSSGFFYEKILLITAVVLFEGAQIALLVLLLTRIRPGAGRREDALRA